MDNQTLFMMLVILSFGLMVLFSIGLYIWYFKLGGKKLMETS
jgi:hypothetical protein